MDINKYIIRATGEEVEVIAYSQEDAGARSFTDWVTYIDSKGTEHIKEKGKNFKLDFKATTDVLEALTLLKEWLKS